MLERIRVSCATLCRIEHGGRYLLLLNANRREKGIYILSPIGGALMYHDRDRLDEFSAVPEDPAKTDLRLTMPVTMIPAFREWFYSGQGRELSPYRELHEELVCESQLLPALEPDDVECHYLWTVEEKTFTMRQGQTGMLTHYFLEIYEVLFKSSAALGPLLAPPSESGAVWVTAEQIEQRVTLSLPIDGQDRNTTVNGYLLLHPLPPQETE